jgi:HK97 family phage prohead protease
MERRSLPAEFAAEGNRLTGYAAVWDSPTEIREGGRVFTEVVRRGAFRNALDGGGDIICTFNHDVNRLLGRTSVGTLKLAEDDKGLRFAVQLPDTATGQEVRALVERGDLKGASFMFAVGKGGDRWEGSKRELLSVQLFELGPVVVPAYPSTSVGLRSASWYKAKIKLMERT